MAEQIYFIILTFASLASVVIGHDITPRSTSCRLVYITAYLTALVLLAAYSAALISSLTVYSSNLPFSDLEGLLKENSYKVGVVSESEMFYTVSDDTDVGIFKDVYSRMLLDQENFPTTTLDGLHRVCKMKFAFMAYPESVLPLIRKVNCSIVPLPYKSYPISLAIAFRANNPYIDFFSYRLRMLRDGGIIHRLRIQNWPFLGQNAVKTSMVGVDLKAVAPLLALLASSVVVSVTILLVENGKFSYSNRHVKNAKTRLQRNMLRIQSVNRNSVKKRSIFYLFPWKLLPHNSRSNSRQHFHVWRD
ncbi:hypothetical protein ANN_24560 [Periplaneta americana]|uniref:Ionotropic glutamate receptor C-terminal domain-containing protein n=1 Tax=Periplaneta americana TaxID=6978 RepID=A0ABQ8S3C6_PERAM|nr:hypothetical protein ANN_24560 [Periplaneta americana]